MIRNYKQIAAALLVLTACTGNLPDDDNRTPEETGEPVSITFDMYTAQLTKAPAGISSAPEAMKEGKTFKIYAYNSKVGTTPNFATEAPVDSAIYTVEKQSDEKLVAKGDMKLYRGTYYMYLVSYNDDTAPVMGERGTISVGNGKDFMYTTLENIVVQPTAPGGNSMTVSLPSPFIRMGSQVVVRARTKSSSPVPVSELEVREIKVSGLPASLDYKLGNTAWESCSAYSADYTYPGNEFKRYGSDGVTDSDSQFDFWRSLPRVLLPVDGSSLLKFDVKLWVRYNSNKQEITKVYPASIQKVLLPGMTYVFDFTLTFYGEIIPSDLTLAIREYNTIPLESDGLGE
ncbi:fimbrillin family protein [uncultured Parabacteroides sp.]|uniref:fimbrillin family protein n=1 Tax=uncultured Parabacteroides sp. TaxID=512312 RepID=UPI0025F46AC1|nr:fimbrillin family protein [uncultured Parabacteroides sp.]